MMSRLLESGNRSRRSFRAMLPSVLLHAGIIMFAVYATAKADVTDPLITPLGKITYVMPPAAAAEPSAAPRSASPSTSPNAGGADVSTVSVPKVSIPMNIPDLTTIPTEIPDPLQSALGAATDPRNDFGPGSGVMGPRGGGGVGDGPGGPGGGPRDGFTIFEVDEPAAALPGSPKPQYPHMLVSAHIVGAVSARFVIDTTGRFVPGSFQMISSDHELFTAAVKNALTRTRFRPARVAGRPVRQLVQQQFAFTLKQ